MRALQIQREHDMPVLTETAEPAMGPGMARVRVSRVGLNYADTMVRRGFYAVKPPFPHVPGLEFAGVIEETGEGVEGWNRGDRVMAVSEGAAAEQLVVPAVTLMRAPDEFSDAEAAAFPVVYLTAWSMLRLHAAPQAGESILVHAAGGGVGTATIQLAKTLGLRVIAAASSDAKLDLARSLGADVAINYSSPDWPAEVKRATGGRGADIIFDANGADSLMKDLDAAAIFGRIVVFGFADAQPGMVPAGALIHKNITVAGFWLVRMFEDPQRLGAIIGELLQTVRAHRIKPVIGREYRIEQAQEAFSALESRESQGKLVLSW